MVRGALARLAYGLATLFAPRFVAGRYAAVPESESTMTNLVYWFSALRVVGR